MYTFFNKYDQTKLSNNIFLIGSNKIFFCVLFYAEPYVIILYFVFENKYYNYKNRDRK